MRIFFTIALLSVFTSTAFAQDDLLKMMENENPQKATPVYATFKSTRIINLQSNETMKAKHLDFRIQHRFTQIDLSEKNNYGFYNYFGLDGAKIRIGLEYGITDRIMVGVGRTNLNNFYDIFGKVKLARQTSQGTGGFPLGITYFANTGITAMEFTDKTRVNYFSSRLSFVHQLILSRKVNDHMSIALVPTFVHHNLVADKSTPNDVFALGAGVSLKLTRSTRFNIEYIPRLTGRDNPRNSIGAATYHDAVAIGFDIETGGHVFQLHFTNAIGLAEQQVITENMNPINQDQIRFGFNISRTFSFDK